MDSNNHIVKVIYPSEKSFSSSANILRTPRVPEEKWSNRDLMPLSKFPPQNHYQLHIINTDKNKEVIILNNKSEDYGLNDFHFRNKTSNEDNISLCAVRKYIKDSRMVKTLPSGSSPLSVKKKERIFHSDAHAKIRRQERYVVVNDYCGNGDGGGREINSSTSNSPSLYQAVRQMQFDALTADNRFASNFHYTNHKDEGIQKQTVIGHPKEYVIPAFQPLSSNSPRVIANNARETKLTTISNHMVEQASEGIQKQTVIGHPKEYVKPVFQPRLSSKSPRLIANNAREMMRTTISNHMVEQASERYGYTVRTMLPKPYPQNFQRNLEQNETLSSMSQQTSKPAKNHLEPDERVYVDHTYFDFTFIDDSKVTETSHIVGEKFEAILERGGTTTAEDLVVYGGIIRTDPKTNKIIKIRHMDSFPKKLMRMLDEDPNPSAITWLPHGRAFIIRDTKKFLDEVHDKYFTTKATNLRNFQRKLNMWGFKRLNGRRDNGAYYHMLFLRGFPNLVRKLALLKRKNGIRYLPNPEEEPNFYELAKHRPLHKK